MIPSEVTEQVQDATQTGRFERYRSKADPAIAVVSAFYLVLLLTPRVAITSLESSRAIWVADVVFWAILVADTAYRVVLTNDPRVRAYRVAALALLMTGPLVLFQISETTRDLVRLALIAGMWVFAFFFASDVGINRIEDQAWVERASVLAYSVAKLHSDSGRALSSERRGSPRARWR